MTDTVIERSSGISISKETIQQYIAWLEDAAHEELLIEIYDHLAEKADSML